jgi:hypothetical protein
MSEYTHALSDARECIRLSNGVNVKGYFRLAKAAVSAGLYNEAIEGLEEGIERRGGERQSDQQSEEGERGELKKLLDNVKARKKVFDKKVANGEVSKKREGRREKRMEHSII